MVQKMYELGITVAFLIWLVGIGSIIVRKNSLLERNLNKIGRRTSLFGLGVTDAKYPKPSIWVSIAKFALLIIVNLPFIFLSWGYVALVVLFYAYAFTKDIGAPQSFKEYRWKLRNIDMSFNEIIKEIVKLEGLDESEYPRVRQEWIDYIDRLKSNQ